MADVFESVFSSINAIVYRCRNDPDYTIEALHGSVESILGYRASDILNNAVVSWVGLTSPDDEARLIAEVDAAIDAGTPWEVVYRMRHAKGHFVWVRARGCAVYEDGELTHLQGLVVSAEEETALRLQLEEKFAKTRVASDGIAALTKNITSSVRELSMLSVNANIEAARSGDAGKGFAIVAQEIKLLAERNAGWAGKIAEQVEKMSDTGH